MCIQYLFFDRRTSVHTDFEMQKQKVTFELLKTIHLKWSLINLQKIISLAVDIPKKSLMNCKS